MTAHEVIISYYLECHAEFYTAGWGWATKTKILLVALSVMEIFDFEQLPVSFFKNAFIWSHSSGTAVTPVKYTRDIQRVTSASTVKKIIGKMKERRNVLVHPPRLRLDVFFGVGLDNLLKNMYIYLVVLLSTKFLCF